MYYVHTFYFNREWSRAVASVLDARAAALYLLSLFREYNRVMNLNDNISLSAKTSKTVELLSYQDVLMDLENAVEEEVVNASLDSLHHMFRSYFMDDVIRQVRWFSVVTAVLAQSK